MNLLDLFSGIGGFSLGLERARAPGDQFFVWDRDGLNCSGGKPEWDITGR